MSLVGERALPAREFLAVRALELCGQTREQQARIRRACRFSVLAHSAMTEGYDRFL